MSLLKQVSIVLGFIFLILFVSIIGLSFNIIKDSSAKSLYENVQNSVTSTSLSITNAGVDEGTIKTVINAAFDNGNYEKIVFKNINDEIVYELKKDLIISDEIPHWFINIVDTGEISALASISEGWNVLGVLEIYADRAIYYNQTYSMFIKLLQSLAFSFVVLIIILSIFFNPFTPLYFPGFSFEPFSSFAIVLYNTSLTNVDFPEPDTPVTQLNTPSGNVTVIFFKLFSVAPSTSMHLDFICFLLFLGII